jgi:hypothetical protein
MHLDGGTKPPKGRYEAAADDLDRIRWGTPAATESETTTSKESTR